MFDENDKMANLTKGEYIFIMALKGTLSTLTYKEIDDSYMISLAVDGAKIAAEKTINHLKDQ